ncbi:MAG TPA: DUF4153 domain-containing protein, partial [Patescibacteria group bacterium]|nr:DUF4153 domain-containing protein [Patescibacteria group bacterium]
MTLRPSAHRFARPLLFAVGLGALAEILFDGPALGVGVVVFVAGLLLAAVVIRPPDAALDRADVWLGPVALVFAAFIGLRADPTLILFDLIVTLLLATGAAIALSGTAVTRAALDRLVRLSGWATAVVLVGCAHLVDAARPWAGVPTLSPERSRTGGALVRGVILAAVPVLVFIGLFTAADSVFARAIDDVTRVSVDLGELPGHLAYVVVTGWLVAGYLAIVAFGAVADSPRGRALVTWSSVFFGTAETANPDPADRPGSEIDRSAPVDEPPVAWGVVPAGSARPSLGWAEATVVLVAIDLVFAAFVAIQV